MQRTTWRDGLAVLASALVLRLVFALVTAGTYDPDEFVLLSLGRQMAHGSVPYRDFMFFHPPGALVVMRTLQPLTGVWWPAARLVMILVDSVSALLVWRIGTVLFSRRDAIAAGLLYAASPVALLGAVRVGQDPLITMLGLAGLLALLKGRGPTAGVLAGVCLGVACWIKYPAVLFLPVYVAVAPRRAPAVVGAAIVTAATVFAPFAAQWHALYAQSVTWQLGRAPADGVHRLAAVASFWLLLNPLALPAAVRTRCPRWVLAGFMLGALFLFTSQVYYHYLVPFVPFAALLSAPLLMRLVARARYWVLAGGALFVALWAVALNLAPVQDGLGALRLSSTDATVRLLDRVTTQHDVVLADQFEYTYLSHRRPATNYFWDMRDLLNARSLEHVLPGTRAVVTTTGGRSYPPGFIQALERQGYLRARAGSATVWIVPPSARPQRSLKIEPRDFVRRADSATLRGLAFL